MFKRLFFIVCLITSRAFCESELYKNNEEIKQVLNQNPYEPSYFTMILGLFMVITLVYLTGYIYQKLTKIKLTKEDFQKNSITIINTTSIGQGRNLHIVKINNENLLIGATQNNITFIKTLENSNGVDTQDDVNNQNS